MTSLKAIAATAVIAVAGTVAAFSGLHLGLSPADAATAAQPAKVKTDYTVTLTAKEFAKLLRIQQNAAGVRHQTRADRGHQAAQVRQTTHQAVTYSGGAQSRSGGHDDSWQRSGSSGGSRCYDNGHSGSYSGSHSDCGGCGW